MMFLNPWLLLALTGASIPVVIHLVRRQAAKPVQWGAMRFLMDTLSERRRRMEWEDLLLMAARCLLLALAGLAIARPVIPPDAPAAWSFVLPAALFGLVLFGGSFVLSRARTRIIVRIVAIALVMVAAGMVAMEQWLNFRRFETSGRREVALVLDTSTSMTRRGSKGTLFDDALEEARRIVNEAPRGTSFVVVDGGPAPRALSATPVSHRADVLAQLDSLRATGGVFRAHEALGVATLSLAEGERPNKEMIVITDGQRHGWKFENSGAWQSLHKAWKALPATPKLLLRQLPMPQSTRNVGIAAVSTTHTLIGTDRPTAIRVDIENTGTSPITAGAVTIEVDGKPAGREALGLLASGQTESVEIRYRFTEVGPHVITARLAGGDDISGDDRADHVVIVRKSLRVLLVDGNPAGGFFQRAAGHTALALAPTSTLIKGQKNGEASGFLMDPVVVAAPDLTAEQMSDAEVVILADVARLPAPLAAALADQITSGGGLIVVAGPRCDPSFYNAWQGKAVSMMPLKIDAETTTEKGVSLQPSTFHHEALAWAADERRSDLSAAVIRRWWKSEITPDSGVLAAAFSNGDVFLATHAVGLGRCVLATCAFDARSGNLPARAGFVPLVHELVTWAAGGGVDWNPSAEWSPIVALDDRALGGLTAVYRQSERKTSKNVLERTDAVIDFDWGSGAPARGLPNDQFATTWTGGLIPPQSGEYLLEAEVDDRISVTLDGKVVLEQQHDGPPRSARIKLEAGHVVPVEVHFEEQWGEAFVRLYWTPPGEKRQIIPPSVWMPSSGGARMTLEAVDPFGQPRKANIAYGRRGRELTIGGVAVPGLYEVTIPEPLAETIHPLASSAKLPVAVCGDIQESRADRITEADLQQLRARVDTLLPTSVGDVLAVFQGRGFGHEITRIVAESALVLLVLELALARWVSRSRRIGDDLRVDFTNHTSSAFGKGGRR